MELADLHIFRTVVEEGGIVRAARRLHRVPSSVSTRIQQLEAAVGAELFHRERQRLHLSSSGELLLAYAEQMLRLSDEARAALAGDAPRGLLRLGSLEATAASRLPGLLAQFHRDHPAVRLSLQTGTNDALTAAVAERRLDAAFVAEPPALAGLAHAPLFKEKLVLVSHPDHPRIRRPEDAVDDTVLAFPEGCAYRRRLLRWLGDTRRPGVGVLDLGSYHAIVACAAAGVGIGVLPESVLDTLGHTAVARHALPRAVGQLVTPLVWREGEDTATLRALRTLLELA
jgi:DNA-binding transcriptional LysR family regulator